MAFDKDINYNVRVNDSDFQSKLTQMRASLDMTLGASGTGFGGMGFGGYGAMMAASMSGGSMSMGGVADFGSQIRPVSYTPAAIAMQPHFGMFQIQQTLGQAGLASAGPVGLGAMSMFSNIPSNISLSEYSRYSSRAFATRIGDSVATGGLVGAETLGGLVGGGFGSAAGTALIGGTIGSLAGGLVGGLPATMLGAAVGDMMAQNRAVQSQLESSSFRYLTGGKDVDPLTGRGFSRGARASIADSIQSQELHDVRFGMTEMRQILEAGSQMDLFSGTKDAEDFKSKFKTLTDTLKTVTATLHTSLKEGIETIRGFRDMGVTDAGDMTRMTLQSESLGRTSGRTGMEMMAVGQTGAEIFRGTGVSMSLGFDLNQQNAAFVKQMINSGDLTRATVAQAGGELALAQQMTGAALAGTQTAFGRGALMANYNPATGGLREGFIGRMAGQDAMSMVSGAAGLAGSPGNLIAFQAHQEDMISGMTPMQLQMFGMAPSMATARTLHNAMGGKFEDSFRFIEQRAGKSRAMIDTDIALLKSDPASYAANQEKAMAGMVSQAGLEDIRNTYGLKAVSNAISRTIVQPFQRGFSALSTSLSETIEHKTMDLLGAATIDPRTLSPEMAARGAALAKETGDVRLTNASASTWQKIIGQGQSGADLAATLSGIDADKDGNIHYRGGVARRYDSVADVEKAMHAQGKSMTILTQSAEGRGGKIVAVTTGDLKVMNDQSRGLQSTESDRSAADSFHATDAQKIAMEGLTGLTGEAVVNAAAKALGFGLGPRSGKQTEIIRRQLAAHHIDGSALADGGAGGAAAGASGRSYAAAAEGMKNMRWKLGQALDNAGGGGYFTMTADPNELRDMMTIADYGADTDQGKLARANLKEKMGDKYEKMDIANRLSNLGGGTKRELRKSLGDVEMLANQGAEQQKALQGDTAGVGGSLGSVSADTMANLQKMAENFKTTMKDLEAMHAKFMEAIKHGG
jgi:hypothetical protein